MKAEDITIRGETGWQEVQVANKSDSIFFSADRKERAEKRRQELIDALPKPRWKYDDPYHRPLVLRDEETGYFWAIPKPLCNFASQILAMLNEKYG